MSTIERAAKSQKPCKKQMARSSSQDPSNKYSDSNSSHSAVNLNGKVNTYIKSHKSCSNKFLSSSHSLQSHNPNSSNQPTFPPSKNIKNTLRKAQKPIWKATLPNTAKSAPIQRTMAEYFKHIASAPKTASRHPKLERQSYLPAQKLFRLGACIKKSHDIQSIPNQPATSLSSSSNTIPKQAGQNEDIQYSYEDRSWRRNQASPSPLAHIRDILDRDINPLSSPSSSHISSFVNSKTSSISASESGMSSTAFSPTQSLQGLKKSNIYTRSRQHHSSNSSIESSISGSDHSTQKSSSDSFQESSPSGIIRPELLLRKCSNLQRDTYPESSISSDSSSHSHLSQPVGNFQDLCRDTIPHNIKIPTRIQSLLKRIQSDSDTISQLRDEYSQREKEIQSSLEELSGSTSQSLLSSVPVQLAQTLDSHSISSESNFQVNINTKKVSNRVSTPEAQKKISKPQRFDFSKLNFVGTASDSMFLSSNESSVSGNGTESTGMSHEPKESEYLQDQEQSPPQDPQIGVSCSSHVDDKSRPNLKSSSSSGSVNSSNNKAHSSGKRTPPPSSPSELKSNPVTIRFSASANNLPRLVSKATSSEPPTFKEKDSIRIIAQNCNGAFHSGHRNSEHYIPSMSSLQGYSPDIICLSETNTDWKVRDMGYDTMLTNKVIWDPTPTKTIMSSCKWNNVRRTTYQPGGVLTLCLNSLPSRIKTSKSDEYGRYTKTVFQAKGDYFISLYNIYRPNPGSASTSGIDTVWMQQYQCFRNHNKDLDPREEFIKDVINDIQKDQENNIFPILVGDFNEDIHRDTGYGIKDLMHSCHLKQIYQELQQEIPSSRLNHRSVFHILVSTKLVQFVERLGVLPLESGFHKSDHRPFYIDHFHKDMFKSRDNPFHHQSIRKLKMYDSPSVEKYICFVKEQMNHHNIIQRFLNLKDYIKSFQFDESAQAELDLLDRQMTDIRIRSENKLRPDPTRFKNATPMQLQVERIRHLQFIIKRIKLNLPTESLIHQLDNVGIHNMDLSSIKAIETRISRERQILRFLHEEEDVVREDHLQALYEKAIEVQNKTKSRIIKNMKMREMQKRTWSKIRYITQDNPNRNVERLGIPKGFEDKPIKDIWEYLSDPKVKPSYTYIVDPKEIERKLLEWQYFHYGQAQETPLASKEWHQNLNPNDLSDAEMEKIMQGQLFQESDLPKESKSFLSHMVKNAQPEMNEDQVKITTSVFRSFYRGARESTSSSPSGLHLGHWKASANDPDISLVLSGIIDLAVTNLHMLPRWLKVVSILMEKIKGSPYIHKFRTIHLLESDLNFVLRYIWGKKFMQHNEKNESLNDSQYGSRKGIQGQSATLNKILTLDTIRYYALPAAIVDNDAKACYDRLIPVVLSYALIRLGLPKNLTRFMCKWLEKTRYFIKTARGVSEHSYQSTTEEYLYGTGQGTGWSPPNWGAISDIISCAMDSNTPGMYLEHPSRNFFSTRSYDSFVDDVNGGLTLDGMHAFHPSPTSSVPLLQNIYEQIQVNVQYYSRLLFTSGGKLALDKCMAYILEFQWNKGVKSFIATEKKYPALKIDQTCENKPSNIKLLNPSESRKMLGVHSAPDGQTQSQYQALMAISKKWGNKVSNGYLNRYDVLTGFKCGLLPALQYPLGVSMLTETQCDKLLVPAMNPLLKKLGIVSTISREIVHGPYVYGGMQIPNLFTIQGIHKIKMILGHLRKEDKTGSIVSIALGLVQQEVGISSPILEASFSKYSILVSHCWIKEVWRFLSTIEGTIVIENVWTPKSPYSNDTNIMEAVMTWDIPDFQKRQINLCRLFFKVYYLGDILDTTGSRQKITISSFSSTHYHHDKFPWIQIPKGHHDIWTYAVQRLLKTYPIGPSIGVLRTHGGFQWKLIDDDDFLLQFHSPRSQSVYKKRQNGLDYILYDKVHEVMLPEEYKIIGVATVRYLNKNTVCLKHRRVLQQAQTKDTHHPSPYKLNCFIRSTSQMEQDRFRSIIKTLGPAHERNIGLLHSMQHLRELAIAITNKKLMGVGDSSVQNYSIGHSYILETIPPKFNMCGVAPVDCAEEEATSNRGESCTVLAMVSVIYAICKLYNIQEGLVDVYCDNMQGLRRRIISKSTFTTLNLKDTDIKMELEWLLSRIPIEVAFKHVKGHADSSPDFVYSLAPQQTQRNIDMDKNAQLFLQYPPPNLVPTNVTTYFPAQKAALCIHGNVIVGDLFVHIHMQKHGYIMEQRLERKKNIPKSSQHVVDWPALKLAFKQSDLNEKLAATKIMHELWPTAKILSDRDTSLSSTCLRCNKSVENHQHIFQCACRQSKSAFRTSLLTFLKKIKTLRTAAPILDCFKIIILAYHNNEKPVCPKYNFGDKNKFLALQKAFSHQLLLGPSSFLSGYLSYKWSVVQTLYVTTSFKTIYNVPWASQIIRSMWHFSSSLWTKRCAQVHIKIPELDASLTTEELRQSLRPYLKLARPLLSSVEKRLHDNVRRHLQRATSTTLARWLHLLSTERSKTIRSKRDDGIRKGGLRQITTFFRRRSSLAREI